MSSRKPWRRLRARYVFWVLLILGLGTIVLVYYRIRHYTLYAAASTLLILLALYVNEHDRFGSRSVDTRRDALGKRSAIGSGTHFGPIEISILGLLLMGNVLYAILSHF